MTRVKKQRLPSRSLKKTRQLQRRRPATVYGPISHDIVTSMTEESFETGGTTTNFGWLYGKDIIIKASSLDTFISNLHGELRVNKITIHTQAFLAPNDLSVNMSTPDGRKFAGTIRGQDIACFGFLLMDGERASETVKFENVTDFRAHPSAHAKLFTEGQICSLRATWLPTEPSDREWVSRANSHTFLRVIFLGTNCSDGKWVMPGKTTASNGRKFIFQTRYIFHVSLRGKKTTVDLPLTPVANPQTSSPSTPDLSQWTIT